MIPFSALDDLAQRLERDIVWKRVEGSIERPSTDEPILEVSWRLGKGGQVRFTAIDDDPRHVLLDDAGFVRAATPERAIRFLTRRMQGLPSRGAWDKDTSRASLQRWSLSVMGGGLTYAATVLVIHRLGMTSNDTAFILLLLPASLLVGIGAAIDRFVGDRERPEGMLSGLLVASTRHSIGLALPCLISAAMLFIASAII